jgi:phospholipid/cholesterol/gamma-HCH transport system permease protein
LQDSGLMILRLEGRWSLAQLELLAHSLGQVNLQGGARSGLRLDGSALQAIDTAAALLVWRSIAQAGIDPVAVDLAGFSDSHRRIVALVRERLGELGARQRTRLPDLLTSLGKGFTDLGRLLFLHLGFLGVAVSAIAAAAVVPTRLRWRELLAQLSQTCTSAIPVISLVMFLIGVVVAYLLGLQATQYGANIFVVDGVALGMVREFSPLLVAIIVAGRSGAAFTAQLGTMRLTDEIDAIRTLGLSVEQVLIVPRVLAMVLGLPLLVFVGNLLGLAGAAMICASMLDITPTTFIARIEDTLEVRHYLIGLAKAPVFALFVAVIGCAMGMTVGRDTRSIGINTTSTVVQSIVAVILLDALFAVLMQELGL